MIHQLFNLLQIISSSTNIYNIIYTFIQTHGYSAVFALMALEGSSLPVPSEIVLPVAGLLAEDGVFSFYGALVAALLGSMVGLAVDYTIGYYVEKDVVYKHLQTFHIKKESLEKFDAWFDRNAIAAVFFSRFIPGVRTLISFPAGFAKMPLKEFFAYSTIGSLIWDLVLMLFGFYLLSATNAVVVLTSLGVFAIALYGIYKLAMGKIRS